MIYHDLPAAEYHARDGISKSGLDKVAISPAHYRASIDRPERPEEALIIGQAVHTMTLEPHKFDEEFVVGSPGLDRRYKAGKEEFAELEASGKTVLTYAQFETVQGIAMSVRSHSVALDLITGGHAEVSFDHVMDGITVRGRCDFLRDDGLVVDLKTTKSAHYKSFTRSVRDFRYHVQAAIYSDLLEANGVYVSDFVFVAVEKVYPFAVGIYRLDDATIEMGREQYLRDLQIYRQCVERGEWPGYPEEVVTLGLANWF